MMKMRNFISRLTVIIVAGNWLSAMAGAVAPLSFANGLSQARQLNVTCGDPATANVDACRQIEERILKSTVLIRIDTWAVKPHEPGYAFDFSVGHATVKGGRYLVTHNHFSVPLSIRPRAGEPEAYGALTLFNSQGEPRFRGSLSDFDVFWEDSETLVISHQEPNFFEKLGFISAEFNDGSSAPLRAGMEVAQVDWDGASTRVDWTTVKEINVDDGVPWMVLSSDITAGASGGGVFWQGAHIANNWLQVQYLDGSDVLVGAAAKAALNSTDVAGEPRQTRSLAGPQ